MSQKKVIKISVTPSAKTVLESFAKKHDMTEIGIASRVYEWWSRQDDIIRKGVLDLLPEGYEPEVTRLALERIAAEKSHGKNGNKK